MHKPMPPLNALRAFEATARHLSMTRAAQELNVTPGALSHQIRGLEEMLGVSLFERSVRAIALTNAGLRLYPGLRAAFVHIREALDTLVPAENGRILVVSTLPGFTAKWLAPRLYRFSAAHPDIDARISSTTSVASFTVDGVDVAIRNLPAVAPADPDLLIEKLIDVTFLPVCSPGLIERHGPFRSAASIADAALIHDDSLATATRIVGWSEWFARAGVTGVDPSRGLRFNSADHALDATVEGGGILLAPDVLAYDELRTGRLAIPFDRTLPSGRAYHFVCPKRQQGQPKIAAFRAWLKTEVDAMDWGRCRKRRALDAPLQAAGDQPE